MQIKEICDYLENLAPISLEEEYDNCGLIIGNGKTEIKKALISLDCTENVIDEAIHVGAGIIISHHPIIFKGLKKINGNNYVERCIIKAIKYDIAIYAIHTNLDNIIYGVNSKICSKLGIVHPKVLCPKENIIKKLVTFCPKEYATSVREALFKAGAGDIGNYSKCSFSSAGEGTFYAKDKATPFAGIKNKLHKEKEIRIETLIPNYLEQKIVKALINSHPYEEVAYDIHQIKVLHPKIGTGIIGFLPEEMLAIDFLRQVKHIMNAGIVKHTDIIFEKVKNIAVCGGSGSSLLPKAIKAGAHVFITADYKYHDFFDAEGKIIIADIGHFESESFTGELLLEKLSKKFPNFELALSKVKTNPVNYL